MSIPKNWVKPADAALERLHEAADRISGPQDEFGARDTMRNIERQITTVRTDRPAPGGYGIPGWKRMQSRVCSVDPLVAHKKEAQEMFDNFLQYSGRVVQKLFQVQVQFHGKRCPRKTVGLMNQMGLQLVSRDWKAKRAKSKRAFRFYRPLPFSAPRRFRLSWRSRSPAAAMAASKQGPQETVAKVGLNDFSCPAVVPARILNIATAMVVSPANHRRALFS